MDKLQLDQSSGRNLETPPVQAGSFDNIPVEAKRRDLEILLGNKNLDPERAEAIRKQIADIDSGKVSPIPAELGAQSFATTEALNSGANFSKEALTNLLNGSGDFKFINADQPGAGFNEMGMLIEAEKRKAANN